MSDWMLQTIQLGAGILMIVGGGMVALGRGMMLYHRIKNRPSPGKVNQGDAPE